MDTLGADIRKRATAAWDGVIKIGEANGYRNAQASVIAPTGTIGFMMDRDTTGIEPDFAGEVQEACRAARCRSSTRPFRAP